MEDPKMEDPKMEDPKNTVFILFIIFSLLIIMVGLTKTHVYILSPFENLSNFLFATSPIVSLFTALWVYWLTFKKRYFLAIDHPLILWCLLPFSMLLTYISIWLALENIGSIYYYLLCVMTYYLIFVFWDQLGIKGTNRKHQEGDNFVSFIKSDLKNFDRLNLGIFIFGSASVIIFATEKTEEFMSYLIGMQMYSGSIYLFNSIKNN